MKLFYRFSKETALKIDLILGTGIKEWGGKLYRYLLARWSLVRRVLDPIGIRLRYMLGIGIRKDLRLHLGCGSKHFDDYINVGLWITDATDIICDITRLPWPDNTISVIENYHVFEHISHTKARQTLAEWYRVLVPDGVLILECPHFDEAVKEYLAGNEDRLINIFGRQRSYGDAHLYGYNPSRLINLLEEAGFTDCVEASPKSSQSLDEPSFRIECKKPD